MVVDLEGGAPPVAGHPGAERLPRRALSYLNARDGLGTVILAALLAGAAAFITDPALRTTAWIGVLVLTIAGVLVELPWLNRIQTRATSYTVTTRYIYIVRGRLRRHSVMIATPQVLNVEIVQGPLLRAFGLVSVRFTCITEFERLGPLTPEAAERARAQVLASQTGERDG